MEEPEVVKDHCALRKQLLSWGFSHVMRGGRGVGHVGDSREFVEWMLPL